MKTKNFFFKAFFLILTLTFFMSCTNTELNEETGEKEATESQIDKEDIRIPPGG